MPSSTVTVGKYRELYAPVAGLVLNPPHSREMFLLFNSPSGISKLVGTTFCDAIIDLLILVISNCCSEQIKSVFLFQPFLFQFGYHYCQRVIDLLSHLEVIDTLVSSVSQFIFNTFTDWCKCTSNCLCLISFHAQPFTTFSLCLLTLTKKAYYYFPTNLLIML